MFFHNVSTLNIVLRTENNVSVTCEHIIKKQLKKCNLRIHIHNTCTFNYKLGICREGNTLVAFTVVTPCTYTLGILLTKPTSWTKPLRGDARASWWLGCRHTLHTDVRIVNNVNLKKKKKIHEFSINCSRFFKVFVIWYTLKTNIFENQSLNLF